MAVARQELARHWWWLAFSGTLAVVVGLVTETLIPVLVYVGVNNIGTWLYVDQLPTGHGPRMARMSPYLAALLVPIGLPLVLLATNGRSAVRSPQTTLDRDPPTDPPAPTLWW